MVHGGMVDDYAGDGLKANFGVPLSRTSESEIRQDAVKAGYDKFWETWDGIIASVAEETVAKWSFMDEDRASAMLQPHSSEVLQQKKEDHLAELKAKYEDKYFPNLEKELIAYYRELKEMPPHLYRRALHVKMNLLQHGFESIPVESWIEQDEFVDASYKTLNRVFDRLGIQESIEEHE